MNSPIVNYDEDGHEPRGAHHAAIQNRIVSMYYPYMRPEVPVVKFTGSPGRIDLVNILTGECWEIKPYHSENMGNDQLANYVHGHFVNPNLVKGNKLKRGGFIAPGVFEDQTARVYYWYAGRGILLSTNAYSAKEGTAFFVEINYLLEHGYRIVSEGWKLVR